MNQRGLGFATVSLVAMRFDYAMMHHLSAAAWKADTLDVFAAERALQNTRQSIFKRGSDHPMQDWRPARAQPNEDAMTAKQYFSIVIPIWLFTSITSIWIASSVKTTDPLPYVPRPEGYVNERQDDLRERFPHFYEEPRSRMGKF